MECIWCKAFYKSKVKKAKCFICKKQLVQEDKAIADLMNMFGMK